MKQVQRPADPGGKFHRGMTAGVRELFMRARGLYLAPARSMAVMKAINLADGDELVHRFMGLIDRRRPLHVSIVGGEPLVRYRELSTILPILAERDMSQRVVADRFLRRRVSRYMQSRAHPGSPDRP